MHGNGVYIWPDGRSYEGGYAFGKKDGMGTYLMGDRNIYKGLWKEGLQHGEGVLTQPDGNIIKGIWEHGVLTKQIDEKSQANDQLEEEK